MSSHGNKRVKECRTCGLVKEITAFYTHPEMQDGHVNHCKECQKARLRLQRSADDHVRDLEAERYRVNPTRKLAINKRHLTANRERYALMRWANGRMQRALKRGELTRPDRCEGCGIECKPDGAHSDYRQPLLVRWLCRRCHSLWDSRDPKTKC